MLKTVTLVQDYYYGDAEIDGEEAFSQRHLFLGLFLVVQIFFVVAFAFFLFLIPRLLTRVLFDYVSCTV